MLVKDDLSNFNKYDWWFLIFFLDKWFVNNYESISLIEVVKFLVSNIKIYEDAI